MPLTHKQFRAALKRLGIKQTQAAVRLGVSDRTVRNWVAGKHRIPEPVALLIRVWARER